MDFSKNKNNWKTEMMWFTQLCTDKMLDRVPVSYFVKQKRKKYFVCTPLKKYF